MFVATFATLLLVLATTAAAGDAADDDPRRPRGKPSDPDCHIEGNQCYFISNNTACYCAERYEAPYLDNLGRGFYAEQDCHVARNTCYENRLGTSCWCKPPNAVPPPANGNRGPFAARDCHVASGVCYYVTFGTECWCAPPNRPPSANNDGRGEYGRRDCHVETMANGERQCFYNQFGTDCWCAPPNNLLSENNLCHGEFSSRDCHIDNNKCYYNSPGTSCWCPARATVPSADNDGRGYWSDHDCPRANGRCDTSGGRCWCRPPAQPVPYQNRTRERRCVPATGVIMYAVAGTVRSALDGSGVTDAFVEFDGTGDVAGTRYVARTTADGTYSVTVPAGTYDVTAPSRAGYANSTRSALVVDADKPDVDFAVTPALHGGQLRVVLTWGAAPRDLDLHVRVSPAACEVYFSDRVCRWPRGVAVLDHDVTSGYGPETITINATGAAATDVFAFFVHQYSSDSSLAASAAKLELYVPGTAAPRAWYVPTSGHGVYWNAFYVTGAGVVKSVDEISNDKPPYSHRF